MRGRAAPHLGITITKCSITSFSILQITDYSILALSVRAGPTRRSPKNEKVCECEVRAAVNDCAEKKRDKGVAHDGIIYDDVRPSARPSFPQKTALSPDVPTRWQRQE